MLFLQAAESKMPLNLTKYMIIGIVFNHTYIVFGNILLNMVLF